MVLSYSHSNQTQFSTVFPSQKEMDRVGVEATTSASLGKGCSFCFLSNSDKEDYHDLKPLIFQKIILNTYSTFTCNPIGFLC